MGLGLGPRGRRLTVHTHCGPTHYYVVLSTRALLEGPQLARAHHLEQPIDGGRLARDRDRGRGRGRGRVGVGIIVRVSVRVSVGARVGARVSDGGDGLRAERVPARHGVVERGQDLARLAMVRVRVRV